jgi:thiol-disulfide isomerase/thioredoxin
MSYLDSALGAVGALGLVNLVLTVMVIRRTRRTAERIAAAPPRSSAPVGLHPGMPAGNFTAVTISGDSLTLADLTGERSLVGFFSPGCGPCEGQVLEFAELAGKVSGGARHVLAVVAAAEEERAAAVSFAAGLDGLASVVIEPAHGPVATAFAARGFPTVYVVGADGRIEAGELAVAMLPALATT